MTHQIVMVTKEHPDGKIDGTWIQGCCTGLEEGIRRTKNYAENGRGTPYTLIEDLSVWRGIGHEFYGETPVCEIFRGTKSASGLAQRS